MRNRTSIVYYLANSPPPPHLFLFHKFSIILLPIPKKNLSIHIYYKRDDVDGFSQIHPYFPFLIAYLTLYLTPTPTYIYTIYLTPPAGVMGCGAAEATSLCLLCCSQPLCVVSQQNWSSFFVCLINFPILPPPPPQLENRRIGRPAFANYGHGNTKPANPDHFMKTHSVAPRQKEEVRVGLTGSECFKDSKSSFSNSLLLSCKTIQGGGGDYEFNFNQLFYKAWPF